MLLLLLFLQLLCVDLFFLPAHQPALAEEEYEKDDVNEPQESAEEARTSVHVQFESDGMNVHSFITERNKSKTEN